MYFCLVGIPYDHDLYLLQCTKLQNLGFDSLVVITSKTKPVELHDGSDKGRQFLEDFPDYFEEFIHYCKGE